MNFYLAAASAITLFSVLLWEPRSRPLSRRSHPWSGLPRWLDGLPWVQFHSKICIAIGSIWIASGFVVMLVSPLDQAIRADFETAGGGGLGEQIQLNWTASAYLAGLTAGALLSGWATDLLGRKKLIMSMGLVYAWGSILSGLSLDIYTFMFFRFIIGLGIGGQYVAINSVLQELIPARRRGAAVIIVNGSFWAGDAISALISLGVSPNEWRWIFVAAGIAAATLVLGVVHFWVPESPRWLVTEGRIEEARAIVRLLEKQTNERSPEPETWKVIDIFPRRSYRAVWNIIKGNAELAARVVVGVALMTSQAFLYNGAAFNYVLLLKKFFSVSDGAVGCFAMLFAIANLLGAVALGHFFDAAYPRRKNAITCTYACSGAMIASVGLLFWEKGLMPLGALGWAACWAVTFFIASPAASAAYLTVGEVFSPGMRAKGIAFTFAVGTATGGMAAPSLLERLVQAKTETPVFCYFLFAAALMIGAAAINHLESHIESKIRSLIKKKS